MIPSRPYSLSRQREDRARLRAACYPLVWRHLLMLALIVALAVLVWLLSARYLHPLLARLPQLFLSGAGGDLLKGAVEVLYWVGWALLVAWALILVNMVVAVSRHVTASAGRVVVPLPVLRSLRGELSEEALSVLAWVWPTPQEPLDAGGLWRTQQELGVDRVGRLAMAQAQSEVLQLPPAPGHEIAAGPERRERYGEERPGRYGDDRPGRYGDERPDRPEREPSLHLDRADVRRPLRP